MTAATKSLVPSERGAIAGGLAAFCIGLFLGLILSNLGAGLFLLVMLLAWPLTLLALAVISVLIGIANSAAGVGFFFGFCLAVGGTIGGMAMTSHMKQSNAQVVYDLRNKEQLVERAVLGADQPMRLSKQHDTIEIADDYIFPMNDALTRRALRTSLSVQQFGRSVRWERAEGADCQAQAPRKQRIDFILSGLLTGAGDEPCLLERPYRRDVDAVIAVSSAQVGMLGGLPVTITKPEKHSRYVLYVERIDGGLRHIWTSLRDGAVGTIPHAACASQSNRDRTVCEVFGPAIGAPQEPKYEERAATLMRLAARHEDTAEQALAAAERLASSIHDVRYRERLTGGIKDMRKRRLIDAFDRSTREGGDVLHLMPSVIEKSPLAKDVMAELMRRELDKFCPFATTKGTPLDAHFLIQQWIKTGQAMPAAADAACAKQWLDSMRTLAPTRDRPGVRLVDVDDGFLHAIIDRAR